MAGGGTCRQVTNILSKSCGGPMRGTCSSRHVCECKAGWVGPQCLSHDGFDPVSYDKPDDFQDLEFTGPYIFVQGIALLLITSCAAIIIAGKLLCYSRMWWRISSSNSYFCPKNLSSPAHDALQTQIWKEVKYGINAWLVLNSSILLSRNNHHIYWFNMH